MIKYKTFQIADYRLNIPPLLELNIYLVDNLQPSLFTEDSGIINSITILIKPTYWTNIDCRNFISLFYYIFLQCLDWAQDMDWILWVPAESIDLSPLSWLCPCEYSSQDTAVPAVRIHCWLKPSLCLPKIYSTDLPHLLKLQSVSLH